MEACVFVGGTVTLYFLLWSAVKFLDCIDVSEANVSREFPHVGKYKRKIQNRQESKV
jgi:hypothetical protein